MKKRIFLIVAGVLVLVIVGVVVYVATNLDIILKKAIERYGSEATKTEVRVSSVKTRLSEGEASISGLTVANPPGFTDPDIFSLGSIAARVEAGSITGPRIVIDDVRIAGPKVFYEITKSGASNLDALKKNLQGPGPGTKEPGEKKAKGKGKETKLFIRKLVIENGRVDARIAALGGKPISLDLPRIELTDIGRNGGATPAEVAKTVATALAEETLKTVARSQGEKLLRKGTEDLLKRYLGK